MVTPFASFDLMAEGDEVLNATYFSDTNTVILVLAFGDIYQISNSDQSDATIEIVGGFDAGIKAAQWSPDEEVLALTTADKSFVLLTRYFDVISEYSMNEGDFKLSKHVSVGWGKKETQFRGRGARAQQDPTMPTYVDRGILTDNDTKQVQISWRGDGEVVAINTVDSIPEERRTIRVFTREGVLDSISEPVDRLEGVVSWRPSGNLIAAVQRKPNESPDLVFFERNGLRRGEFSLRVDEDRIVKGLDWNAESDTLAVWMDDRVQLWTTKNYYWYLKAEIKNHAVAPTYMKWHPEQPRTLLINYGESFEVQEYIWDICRGATAGNSDVGMVLVIDGTSVNLTPLSIANVPPPMFFRDFTVSATPKHVAVNKLSTYYAALVDEKVEIATLSRGAASLEPRNFKTPEVINEISYSELGLKNPRQIAFIGDSILVFLGDSGITVINLLEDLTYEIVSQFEEFADAVLLKSLPGYENAFFQTLKGDVYAFLTKSERVGKVTELPKRCDAVEVYFPGPEEPGIPVAFGLHSTGRLYANERQIASSATSLCMTEEYIAFTTAQHYLKFCHLKTDPNKIEVPEDQASDDERCRAIERGSLIVTAMPSRTAFTLQAPRGNLETIYPRVMVLSDVRKKIRGVRYDLAFKVCRVHRIDLNILFDYMPKQFYSKLDVFIEQLDSVEYLDLFLSGLRNEDVSQTMYRETLEESGQTVDENSSLNANKVNDICDKVVEHLKGKEKYLQSVLTAYACKSPPALKDALTLVGADRETKPKETEFSIQHLCFLQDVNLLYDTSLSIYDLPLTLLIAQQSQKDPKEYLPFLRSLHKLSEGRRRFEIDTYLGNFEKALTQLVELASENSVLFESELVPYVQEHDLYQLALKLYKNDEIRTSAIYSVYADYLQGKTQYEQAALILEYLDNKADAADLYEMASCWRQCLTLDPSEERALRLAEALASTHDHRASATIYLDYLNDKPSALKQLAQGYHLAEARRLSSGREDLELIKPYLLENFATITELVSDCRSQLISQSERLQVLREKKLSDPIAFFGAEASDQDYTADNVSIVGSEASTNMSFMTKYTGKTAGTAMTGASRRTAKNRRREERKRARGKKGSVYEEEYILKSLVRLVERLNSQLADAYETRDELIRWGPSMREMAWNIQSSYDKVMKLANEKVQEVFKDDQDEKEREQVDEEGNVYVVPKIEKPTVNDFVKVQLLEY